MKAYRGVVVYLHVFLTSELDGGGEWSASRPGHFTLRERTPGTHWIGSWVVKRKIPSTRRELNPVAQRYTD